MLSLVCQTREPESPLAEKTSAFLRPELWIPSSIDTIGAVKVGFKMWLQGGFMHGFRPTVNFGFKAEKLLKT